MKLHFDPEVVKKLVEHARSAPDQKLCYGQEKKEPGLLFVGDDGIYLMSNGLPHQPNPDNDTKCLVAYAKECNPKTMSFDEWWAAKQASWGGDDGAEFIPLSSVPESGRIAINIDQTNFAVLEIL